MRIGAITSGEGYRDNGTWALVRDTLKRRMGFGDNLKWAWRDRPILKEWEKDCDFFLYVDDGLDQIPMDIPRPNACWLIDTHLGYDIRREWATHFDYVFTAQKDGAAQLEADGIKNVHWLPLACHPPAHPNYAEVMQNPIKDEILQGKGLDKQYDIGFAGYLNEAEGDGFHNRVKYLDAIYKVFPNSWLSVNVFHEYMATRFIRARLGANISIKNDLNMRFFEVPSTGTTMLTNVDCDGWKDLGFEDGKHFIGYEGIGDAIEKARYYLDHPMEREEIAKVGHQFVRENHTYTHRMKQMFEICGLSVSDFQPLIQETVS